MPEPQREKELTGNDPISGEKNVTENRRSSHPQEASGRNDAKAFWVIGNR
jgi:hypothetical protein